MRKNLLSLIHLPVVVFLSTIFNCLFVTTTKAQEKTDIILLVNQNVCTQHGVEIGYFIDRFQHLPLQYAFVHAIDSSDAEYYIRTIFRDKSGILSTWNFIEDSENFFPSRASVLLRKGNEIIFQGAVETYKDWLPVFENLLSQQLPLDTAKLAAKPLTIDGKIAFPTPAFNFITTSSQPNTHRLHFAMLNMATYSVITGRIDSLARLSQQYYFDGQAIDTLAYQQLIHTEKPVSISENRIFNSSSFITNDTVWLQNTLFYHKPDKELIGVNFIELFHEGRVKQRYILPSNTLRDLAEVTVTSITAVQGPDNNPKTTDSLFASFRFTGAKISHNRSWRLFPSIFSDYPEQPAVDIHSPKRLNKLWFFRIPKVAINYPKWWIARMPTLYPSSILSILHTNAHYYYLQQRKQGDGLLLYKTDEQLRVVGLWHIPMPRKEHHPISDKVLTERGILYLHADKRFRLLEFQLP